MRGGGAQNHTHLISGRAAHRTSRAFAACVVACDLLTVVSVVCLFCVAVGFAGLVFVDSLMVCILHAVLFPPPILFCSGLSGSVLFYVVLLCVL